MKRFIAIALTLLVVSCATLDSNLQKEVGKHVSHAMIKNGAPT